MYNFVLALKVISLVATLAVRVSILVTNLRKLRARQVRPAYEV